MRLAAATAAGAAIGLNRELGHKPAGLRTHVLVALGSAVITLITVQYVSQAAPGDAGAVTRAIQGIVTGIGFVGGGVILRLPQDRAVRGLTTAATIWMVAALGTACGLGQWAPALFGTLLALVVLVIGNWVERFLNRRVKLKGSPPSGYTRRKDDPPSYPE